MAKKQAKKFNYAVGFYWEGKLVKEITFDEIRQNARK